MAVKGSPRLAAALLLPALLALGVWLGRDRFAPAPAPLPPRTNAKAGALINDQLAGQVAAIEAREQDLARTLWAQELLAQRCGRTTEALWDALNAAADQLDLVAEFPVDEVLLGRWNDPELLPHDIELRPSSGPGRTLSNPDWRAFVAELQAAGWVLTQTEFRHLAFETETTGRPRRSRFYFSAHGINSGSAGRAVLRGNLFVDWGAETDSDESPPVRRFDASRLTLATRSGAPPFQPVLTERIAPLENAHSIDPLILYDLDGDGLSEIILAAKNLVYRRRGEGEYAPEPLCEFPTGSLSTALVADFDADGAADFLCQRLEGLALHCGSSAGRFDQPPRIAWTAPADLKFPMVLTCGDIDRDGDLDLFLAQYKVPYRGGAMPTPYFDANDGYPAYLLRNDGHAKFEDVTMAAGLGAKRLRRSYSASFVDLDDANGPDLMVVSDFAGIDLYRNDGTGRFDDVTAAWVPNKHAFGMAHAVADFNTDGRLDLLMIGMPSPTADRLEHLGLWRGESAETRAMRSRMTYGNRLYLGGVDGGFGQTPLSASIARSGWSWGCSAFDFDNDGYPDAYIANGLESRRSVQDYESEYWLHDAHVADSNDNSAAYLYFEAKFGRTRARGQSYGGYEKNRLYLNRQGVAFVEVGHLLGVALEQDSRNVVTDDLDGDGRVDLLVTSFGVWPNEGQTLRVYRNRLSHVGGWIGFRFREEGPGTTPVGVRGELHLSDGRSSVRTVVTGDSHRSQHANTIHFGLGETKRVARAVIRWTDGGSITLDEPAMNRYHPIRAPAD